MTCLGQRSRRDFVADPGLKPLSLESQSSALATKPSCFILDGRKGHSPKASASPASSSPASPWLWLLRDSLRGMEGDDPTAGAGIPMGLKEAACASLLAHLFLFPVQPASALFLTRAWHSRSPLPTVWRRSAQGGTMLTKGEKAAYQIGP